MAYADYVYYSEIYKGTLSEADFERLSERASDYIDGRTNYVLKTADIPEELEERVKKACCALAEITSTSSILETAFTIEESPFTR